MNAKLQQLSADYFLRQRNKTQLTHDVITGAITRINSAISPNKLTSEDLFTIKLVGYDYALAEVTIRDLQNNAMIRITFLPYPDGNSYDREYTVGREAAIDTLVDKLEKILLHQFDQNSADYDL